MHVLPSKHTTPAGVVALTQELLITSTEAKRAEYPHTRRTKPAVRSQRQERVRGIDGSASDIVLGLVRQYLNGYTRWGKIFSNIITQIMPPTRLYHHKFNRQFSTSYH